MIFFQSMYFTILDKFYGMFGHGFKHFMLLHTVTYPYIQTLHTQALCEKDFPPSLDICRIVTVVVVVVVVATSPATAATATTTNITGAVAANAAAIIAL